MAKRSLKDKLDEESKIEFRGQKMKLSKAKTYLGKLKSGEITLELNESERNESIRFMKTMREHDRKAVAGGGKAWFQNYDEKEYFSFILGIKIGFQGYVNEQNYCAKHGHEEVKGSAHIEEGMGKTITWAFCSRCGSMYNRYPTPEEMKEWNELLRAPFDI
jgi:hypothetical protein